MSIAFSASEVEGRVRSELSRRRKVLLLEQTRKDRVVAANEDIRRIKEHVNAAYNNKENLELIRQRQENAERDKVDSADAAEGGLHAVAAAGGGR